jgi:hypothetical protein
MSRDVLARRHLDDLELRPRRVGQGGHATEGRGLDRAQSLAAVGGDGGDGGVGVGHAEVSEPLGRERRSRSAKARPSLSRASRSSTSGWPAPWIL